MTLTHRSLACRVAALSFLVAGTVTLMQAQQSAAVAPNQNAPVLMASDAAPTDLASVPGGGYSSSAPPADALSLIHI